ncbi:MAG: sporulation protein [Candidatus Riflebacteria bacterium]|nr:sporulation protein [Candidatus Riflebacteria bacterium]
MAIDALIKTVLSEMKVAINSKTVIGEPTVCGKWTVIPVTKVSFGFGAGGGQGKNDANFGGGSGGGATLEPVAFLVVSDKEVKLISLKERETVWEKILSPEVGEKVYNKIMGIAKESNAEKASEVSDAESVETNNNSENKNE